MMMMMMMRGRGEVAVVVVIALVAVAAAAGGGAGLWGVEAGNCPFSAIFNFGDSNSDTGGLVAAFPPQARPNGETTFGEPAGRFSDGRLVVDFLAQGLGFPYLNPYLQAIGSNFSSGANFASAGASVLQPTSQVKPNGWLSPFYLQIQLNQFLHLKSTALELYSKGWFMDVVPLPSTFENALYTFDMGQNDFSAQLSNGVPLNQVSAIFPQVVDTIGNTIQALYTTGARFFMVSNLGPLGCYPAILANSPVNPSDLDTNGCLNSFNQVVYNFNEMLKNKIFLLQTQLYGASIIYVDTNAIKYEMWANGFANGFQYTTTACCGPSIGLYNFDSIVPCTASVVQNGQIVKGSSCSDPSKHVSWDGIHFTESANRYVATRIFSGAYFQPSFPITQMCPLFFF
ncbi:hypothetical protein L7F22_048966 [Adiantum nelumboides]|nr:hypothetical protein [Adiantum nelumboides]